MKILKTLQLRETLIKKAFDESDTETIFDSPRIGLINRLEGFASKPEVEDNVFSAYKSGADQVTMETHGGQYTVKVNDVPSLQTESFQYAIAQYYREMAKLMTTQTKEKDLSLEVFGDKVVTMNREIIPKLAVLSKSFEISWLKSFERRLLKDLAAPIQYLTPTEQAPEGVQTRVGDKGGRYYYIEDIMSEEARKKHKKKIGRKIANLLKNYPQVNTTAGFNKPTLDSEHLELKIKKILDNNTVEMG